MTHRSSERRTSLGKYSNEDIKSLTGPPLTFEGLEDYKDYVMNINVDTSNNRL